jgi:hypothetical protein
MEKVTKEQAILRDLGSLLANFEADLEWYEATQNDVEDRKAACADKYCRLMHRAILDGLGGDHVRA